MANKFVKIRCNKCKAEQIMFEKATTSVTCNKCGEPLASPAGGKAKIQAKIIEILK